MASIEKTAKAIAELVPEARVAVAHGQMSEQALEQAMPDLAAFHEIQRSYEANMNRGLAERSQKVGLIKAQMQAEAATYKTHPRLAEFQALERDHLYAGNVEWFFKAGDASKWAWSPDTIDAAKAAGDMFEFRPLGEHPLRGKEQSVPILELVR